ncbi:MAG: formate dehydrogenase subunit gamma [Cocleimonas sp.]|nr:formate dehydrogenase subunit gamma [Cocleimonas sp.]
MDALKWSSNKITSFNFNLSLLACLLITLFAIFSFSPAIAAEDKLGNSNNTVTQQLGVKSPATDLWRAVRQREFKGSAGLSSSSQVKSMGSTEFINIKGQEWRNFRMGQLVPYAAYLLGGVLLVLALFRLIRGKIKIKAGRSGKKILRFSPFQRFVHWSTAILFVILGVTGLLLTFGKSGLIPIIGGKAFGAMAGVGKVIHDYLGPVFGIMLLIMLFTFIKGNFGNWTDVKWFFKGGGMFGGHASAGRYNGGEKAWFWVAILAGAVVVVSGIVLDFPYFNQTRDDLQLSHLVHAIGSVGILAASFGHIFMGTVAMEGAYESMRTGYCDENWAKEHHDLWYDDLQAQGVVGAGASMSGSAVAGVGAVAAGAMLREPSSNASGSTDGSAHVSGGSSDIDKQGLMDTGVSSSKKTPVKTADKKSASSSSSQSKKTGSSSTSGESDNLKKIEGIGPKIEEILKGAGLSTFSQLSHSNPDDIKVILNDAGPRYKMHNPKTWPQQAELADKGAWDELSDLQDRLLGGRE